VDIDGTARVDELREDVLGVVFEAVLDSRSVPVRVNSLPCCWMALDVISSPRW